MHACMGCKLSSLQPAMVLASSSWPAASHPGHSLVLPGLLSGAYKVSEDGCLYAEAFAMRVVNESITSESGRETALRAMNYYFGFVDIPDELVRQGCVCTPAG